MVKKYAEVGESAGWRALERQKENGRQIQRSPDPAHGLPRQAGPTKMQLFTFGKVRTPAPE